MHLILAGHGTAIVEIGNERDRNTKMMVEEYNDWFLHLQPDNRVAQMKSSAF
jgi:hypothetical protein